MTTKTVEPDNVALVNAVREKAESILTKLHESGRDLAILRNDLLRCEQVLIDHDPSFTPSRKRLSHLNSVDAAVVLLVEHGSEMPLEELITRMLADGVGDGRERPADDIRKSLSQAGAAKLLKRDASGNVSMVD